MAHVTREIGVAAGPDPTRPPSAYLAGANALWENKVPPPIHTYLSLLLKCAPQRGLPPCRGVYLG